MVFTLAFIILLILPGYSLVSLLIPQLPWFQRLPAGFAASLTLLGLPAVLLLNLHAPLTTLAWLALPITIIPSALHLHQTITNPPITTNQSPAMSSTANHPITQLPNYKLQIPTYLITHYKLLLTTLLLTLAALLLFLATAAIRDFGDHWFYLTFIRHYLDLPLEPALNPLTGIDVSTGTLSRAATNSWWVTIALLVKVSGRPLLESYWFVLPPLLMVLSLIAFYALAWELFENHKAALTAVLLQLLLYFTSISSHDWIGQGFFTRIAEDKYLVWLVLLPVALFLLLRCLKTGQWQSLLLLAAAVAAIALSHPFGLLQFAFAAACFSLVYLPLNRRKLSRMQTAVLLAPLVLFLIIPIIQLLMPDNFALTQFLPSEIQTPPNDTHLMLFSAENQRYILHPHLIFHPLTLLSIILCFPLLRDIKKSTTNQFLVSTTLLPIILLYNPVTAPMFGRFLSPLLLWRITWILPTALILAHITTKITTHLTQKPTNHQSPITNHQPLLLKIPIILLTLLLTYHLTLYLADGIDLLRDYKTRTVTADQQALLTFLCEADNLSGVVIADPLLNTLIPSCAPRARLLTYRIFQSRPTAAEEIERFYNGRLLAQSSLTFLDDWQAQYIILPAQAPIAAQIARLPELFINLYTNRSYALYQYQPDDHPLTTANEAYIRGRLAEAADGYAAAGDNPAPAAYGLGLVSLAAGDSESAETHLLAAINADPTLPSSYLSLATLYQQDGRAAAAQSLLNEALSHLPDNHRIHQALGDIYLESGDETAAIEQYRQAVPPTTNEADTHLALAGLYTEKGLSQAAFAAYQEVFQAEIGLRRLSNASGIWAAWSRSLTFDRRPERLAAALRELGRYYERVEQNSTAEYLYRQLIELLPTRESSYEPLADFYRRTNRQDETVTLYSKAVRANFHLSWPYRRLAAAFLAEYRRSDEWEPLVKVAVNKLEMARQIEPENAENYELLAQANDLPGRSEEVERLYQEAAQTFPFFAWPLVNLAQLYLEQNDFSAAQTALTAAIDLRPQEQTAYNLLADAYLNRGETAEALALYQSAVAANENSAWPYLGRANALLAAGMTNEALDSLAEGLSREPDNPAVYSTLGNIYRWNAGDPETAVTYFNHSLALNPDQPDVHLALAQIFQQQGASAEALEHAQQAARFSNNMDITAPAQMIEAQIYLAAGRSDEARPLILAALDAFPGDPWYNATAGDYYHYHQDDPAAAVPYYRKAAELAPQHAILQAALATALYDAGQTAEAVPIMEQAIALAPTDPAVYLRIGSVLIKYADWQQLIQFYETAVANNIDHPDINTQLTNAYALQEQQE